MITEFYKVKVNSKFMDPRGEEYIKTSNDIQNRDKGYYPINAQCLTGERKGHNISVGHYSPVSVKSKLDIEVK